MKRSSLLSMISMLFLSFAVCAQANVDPNIVMNNFMALSTDLLIDIGIFAGKTFIKAILLSVLGAVLGVVAGVVLVVIFWKRRWLDAPFSWYRFIKWMWIPIFVLSLLITGSSIGFTLASKSAVKNAVYKEQFIRKTTASMLCSFALGELNHQVDAKTPEKVVEVFQNSEALKTADLSEMSDRAKNILAKSWDEKKGNPFGIKLIFNLIRDWEAAREVYENLIDLDGRVIFSLLYYSSYSRGTYQAHLSKHPEHMAVAGVMDKMFDDLEKDISKTFNSFIQTNLFLSLLFGFGFPLCLVGLFRVALRFAAPHPRLQ